MRITPKQRIPAVELDPRRLQALDPRDDAERWLRALVDMGLPSAAEGPEGSPQALMAELYAGVHALDAIEPNLRQTQSPVRLSFLAPRWTWALPAAVWGLALALALTRDHEDERLMTFATTWGVAALGAIGLLAWMLWANHRARQQQSTLRSEAKAQREEIVGDLVATRDTLSSMGFALRLPRKILYLIPVNSTQLKREAAEALGRSLEVGGWAPLPTERG